MNTTIELEKSEQATLANSAKDNETANTKRPMPYIIQVLLYLYNTRVPFDSRVGLKNIYYTLERHPSSKEILQDMKDFYASIGMTAHASGEFPVPENLAQYQDLEMVDFSEDCFSFKPKVIELRNSKESELYDKAVERYKKSHYIGSEEEADDLRQAEHLEAQRQLEVIENVKSEMKWIQLSPDHYVIPEGCRLVNRTSYIALELITFEGYINALHCCAYDMFDDQVAKFGVQYRVEHAYLGNWDFKREDSYNQAIEELKKRFEIIEKNGKFLREGRMERLKESTVFRAKNLISSYIKSKVTRQDEIALLQMVEDFFATQGIEVQTIVPRPDAHELYLKHKQSSW
jgi:tetratricopeptide (TPR) repeat protein